ncbi:hypothetical protein PAENIP36_55250 [Paenibacillus sp. P36]
MKEPSAEGIVTILNDDTGELVQKLSEFCLNKTKLTIDVANSLDELLRSNRAGKFLSVDR